MTPRTMYRKIWDSHVAYEAPGERSLIYIYRHLGHQGTSPLAFGIGTSEVEHVLATQCLSQFGSKTMHIVVNGKRVKGVSAKDIILAIIGKIGIAGGTGRVVEYSGEAIRALSMDGRMTVCNMSIEGGARAGMIAPDDTTFAYVAARTYLPRGNACQ